MRPSDPLPQLTGLGVNVRAAVPGYPTTAPDGHRRWILGHDDDQVTIDEDHDRGVFIVTTRDLPGPVMIAAGDVHRAAAGVANLIAARVHAARHGRLDVCPWHPESLEAAARADDPVDDQLAAMIAHAFLTRKPRLSEGGEA